MAGENKCFSLVRGRAMRVTKLDGCGNPVPGLGSTIVSDGFVSVALTANTEEGTTISVQNAAGKTCILDEPCPTFTGYSVEVSFCMVDPALFAMMAGQESVMDSAGNAVGFRMNTAVDACASGFALELWSNVPAAACEAGATQGQFGYMLVPFLRGGVLGDFTVANDAINFTLSGANSKDGNGWGTGPYEVIDDGTGAAPLLDALDPNDHLHMQLTTVPPPEVECGGQELGQPATGVDAATGAWTPANSYGPATLTALQASSLDPTPATAWDDGQSVVLGDGSRAWWDGDSWVAGVAP